MSADSAGGSKVSSVPFRPGWKCGGRVVMIVMITAGDAENAKR